MVLVRLPMPISMARSMALMVYSWMLLRGDVALGLGGQVVVQLLDSPLAVDQEDAAGLDVVDHVDSPW